MKTETAEISTHFLAVFKFLRDNLGWHTAKQVAGGAQIADRTARAHLTKLVHLNIADQAEVFPAHRYRLSAHADKRNKGMMVRLQQAEEVLG